MIEHVIAYAKTKGFSRVYIPSGMKPSMHEEVQHLAREFQENRKILLALGDENRQHMMLEIMRMGECRGVRVGAITERTHLSRPAVSHHLRVLREAGLIKMRREGTKNYYYFDADTEAMASLLRMLEHARKIMVALPDRTDED